MAETFRLRFFLLNCPDFDTFFFWRGEGQFSGLAKPKKKHRAPVWFHHFLRGSCLIRLNYSEVLKSKTKIYRTWKWSLIRLMVQKSGENPPGMYKTPADNGIKYQPQLVIARFLVAINRRELWLASTHVPHPWYPTFLPVTGGMTKKANKSAVLIKGNGGGSEEVLKSLFPMRWKSRFFFLRSGDVAFFLTGGQSLQVGNSHHDHHGLLCKVMAVVRPTYRQPNQSFLAARWLRMITLYNEIIPQQSFWQIQVDDRCIKPDLARFWLV